MEDQEQESGSRRSEAVRSRWTPKPEQILILESIFNSGMVNPPKDETVRIRKLLEKFGAVGDANVFYWFQNRRSRSRRRQRQIQASLTAAGEQPRHHHVGATATHFQNGAVAGGGYHIPSPAAGAVSSTYPITTPTSSSLIGQPSSSFGQLVGDDAMNPHGFFPLSGQVQELHHTSIFGPPESSNLHYQSGAITVFINGVATEVGRGAVDMKAMFGGDYVLFHSSGVAVEMNEHGFLVQTLQHGESYFLVPRHS